MHQRPIGYGKFAINSRWVLCILQWLSLKNQYCPHQIRGYVNFKQDMTDFDSLHVPLAWQEKTLAHLITWGDNLGLQFVQIGNNLVIVCLHWLQVQCADSTGKFHLSQLFPNSGWPAICSIWCHPEITSINANDGGEKHHLVWSVLWVDITVRLTLDDQMVCPSFAYPSHLLHYLWGTKIHVGPLQITMRFHQLCCSIGWGC